MPRAQTKKEKESYYRKEIDGLRAFAVIAVIINHFNKSILPGGYLGVDIFFVISGYVITTSLTGRPRRNFKEFILGFYERRIKRLVPALSVYLAITSIAIWLVNPTPDTTLKTGLTSLLGISNIYLIKQSTDYFAESTELNAFTQTWSLGVEQQFYLLFPLLIWLSGFGRQTKHGDRNLLLVLSTLTLASLIGYLYLYPINQPAAYFSMPTRFWEISTGCLIFVVLKIRKSLEEILSRVPAVIALALTIGIMYLPLSYARVSTVAVVALTAIIITSLKEGQTTFKVFTNPKVVYIGKISYSLYLWHWGVLSISRWTFGIYWWSVPIQVLLIFAIAASSFEYIETPLRRIKWVENRWKAYGTSAALIMSIYGVYYLYNKNTMLGNSGNDRYPEEGKSHNLTRDNCHLNFKKTVNDEICFLDNNHKNTIFVFGDSHANAILPILDSDYIKSKYNILTLTGGDAWFPARTIRNKKEFNKFNNQRINILKRRIVEGDIIIVSNHLLKEFDPINPNKTN